MILVPVVEKTHGFSRREKKVTRVELGLPESKLLEEEEREEESGARNGRGVLRLFPTPSHLPAHLYPAATIKLAVRECFLGSNTSNHVSSIELSSIVSCNSPPVLQPATANGRMRRFSWTSTLDGTLNRYDAVFGTSRSATVYRMNCFPIAGDCKSPSLKSNLRTVPYVMGRRHLNQPKRCRRAQKTSELYERHISTKSIHSDWARSSGITPHPSLISLFARLSWDGCIQPSDRFTQCRSIQTTARDD